MNSAALWEKQLRRYFNRYFSSSINGWYSYNKINIPQNSKNNPLFEYIPPFPCRNHSIILSVSHPQLKEKIWFLNSSLVLTYDFIYNFKYFILIYLYSRLTQFSYFFFYRNLIVSAIPKIYRRFF